MAFELPTALALVGTGLAALAIFAPGAPRAPATVSFAPPPPVERWHPPAEDVLEPIDGFSPMPVAVAEVTWPALVDPRARALDAAARIDLADALGTLQAPWAAGILQRALADETDAGVCDALERALRECAQRA